MIVGSLSTEVHQQVDGVAHARRVLGRLEDGLVFGMFLAARFLGRHRFSFLSIRVLPASSAARGRYTCATGVVGCAWSEQVPGGNPVVLGGARPAVLRRRGSASALEELTKYDSEAVV